MTNTPRLYDVDIMKSGCYKKMKAELEEGEYVLEISRRKPAYFLGGCYFITAVIFVFSVIESISRSLFPWALLFFVLAVFFAGLGVYFTVVTKNELAIVTNRQFKFYRAGIKGKPARVEKYPLSDISSVRAYKSGAVLFAKKEHGEVLIKFKNKRTRLVPVLDEGEQIAEALYRLLEGSEPSDDSEKQ